MNQTLSSSDLQKICQALEEHSGKTKSSIYADIFLLALLTGLKANHLLNIKFSDVSSDGTELTIEGVSPAHESTLIVRLSPEARKIVERRKETCPNDIFLFEGKSNRGKGAPISRISAHRKFKEVGDMIGQRFTFNSLRHAYAMNALKHFDTDKQG